jgi:hypothetical protein
VVGEQLAQLCQFPDFPGDQAGQPLSCGGGVGEQGCLRARAPSQGNPSGGDVVLLRVVVEDQSPPVAGDVVVVELQPSRFVQPAAVVGVDPGDLVQGGVRPRGRRRPGAPRCSP